MFGGFQQWVTLFSLSFGFNPNSLQYVFDTTTGQVKEYIGNTDALGLVFNEFSPVLTRFFRLNVLEWHGEIALRWEVFGSVAST